jgi:hypothetical protein
VFHHTGLRISRKLHMIITSIRFEPQVFPQHKPKVSIDLPQLLEISNQVRSGALLPAAIPFDISTELMKLRDYLGESLPIKAIESTQDSSDVQVSLLLFLLDVVSVFDATNFYVPVVAPTHTHTHTEH